MITHSAKETWQQKEQWWGLGVTERCGGGQNLKNGGGGENIVVTSFNNGISTPLLTM